MNAITFDTLSVSKTLKTAGFSEQQAETLTQVIQEAASEDHLVTRSDLNDKFSQLDDRLQKMDARLDDRLEKMEMRIIIRLGTMLFVGFGFLAAIKYFG